MNMTSIIDFNCDWQQIECNKSAVLVFGKFDGVHLGHQSLLKQAKQLSQQLGCIVRVVGFDPAPVQFFTGIKHRVLTDLHTRASLLKSYGADEVGFIKFNLNFSRLGAEYFLQEIVVKRLHAVAVVVGEDFKFGYQQAGNTNTLIKWSQTSGVRVSLAKTVEFNGVRVSTSRCRQCLYSNDIEVLNILLGRKDY